jgi:hypothetical protein
LGSFGIDFPVKTATAEVHGMSNFNDERLQRAVEEAASTLEARLVKLNQVSHDIKELELHLEGSSVRERIDYQFSGGGYAVGDPADAAESGGGAAEELIEWIAWEQAAKAGRWRIMYIKTVREGCWDEVISGLFHFEGEPKVVDHRPLIETPAEVRLRAGDALPDLMVAIASRATPRSPLH